MSVYGIYDLEYIYIHELKHVYMKICENPINDKSLCFTMSSNVKISVYPYDPVEVRKVEVGAWIFSLSKY